MHVLEPHIFLESFLEKASKAKSRIWLQAMTVSDGYVLQKIADVLEKKANQGLDVRLQYDWISHRYVKGDLYLYPYFASFDNQEKLKSKNNKTRMLFNRLLGAGVRVTEIEKPTFTEWLLPLTGRNHMKLYLVDDSYTWIGGINIYDEAYKNFDFMVEFTDPSIVSYCENQFSVAATPQLFCKDEKFEVNADTTLLRDSGKRFQSIILSSAVKMVESASSDVTFISQLVPEGKLLNAMIKKAREGIPVKVVTTIKSDKLFSKFPYNIPYLLFLRSIRDIPNFSFHHSNTKIHAKILITDNKTILFGSHNLVDTGVRLGTKELSILTSTVPNGLLKAIKTL